ncbi:FAD-binding oxidoreductase [Nonomuraea sp. NPDC050404]|uniref:FAD-binding oxidoreductase n=1 Tax=Nonomuraea sp. NPDC050404 TaxID=3155783 RepID=UPI0034061786
MTGCDAICPGRVLRPADPGYDAARQLFNGMHDPRPALIAMPAGTAELSRLVEWAAGSGLPTAVRSTGHNVAGTASAPGGLVIDLRLMNGVRVDPGRCLARVQGGATWADLDAAAARHGLAVTGGTFDTTGVAGLTLGGGVGHLMARYGLACDNVVSFDLVPPAGGRLAVTRDNDPELDWGMRGAGHNFGVVAEFTFGLHPVPHVYGGVVAYPGHAMAEAVRLFRDLAEEAPDELVLIMLLERYGPRQEAAAVMSVCYCGDREPYVRELTRRLRGPELLDWRIERRSYVSMQQILGRLPYGLRHYWSPRCTAALPDELIDALVARFEAGRWRGPWNDTVYIEEFHGAVRATPGSAVPFRRARFNVTGMAIWEPPESDDEQIAWARSVSAAAEPWAVAGDGYPNYLSDRAAAAGPRRTFGADAHDRLVALKRRLDPGNLLRHNYNLDPVVHQ